MRMKLSPLFLDAELIEHTMQKSIQVKFPIFDVLHVLLVELFN